MLFEGYYHTFHLVVIVCLLGSACVCVRACVVLSSARIAEIMMDTLIKTRSTEKPSLLPHPCHMWDYTENTPTQVTHVTKHVDELDFRASCTPMHITHTITPVSPWWWIDLRSILQLLLIFRNAVIFHPTFHVRQKATVRQNRVTFTWVEPRKWQHRYSNEHLFAQSFTIFIPFYVPLRIGVHFYLFIFFK